MIPPHTRCAASVGERCDCHGPYIRTYNGGVFYPLSPRASDVDIRDIAKALSQINRYTGHTTVPYSVAEHSVDVSRRVPPSLALWGLLHDAAEAYIGDVSSPLKSLLQDYRAIEHRVEQCVWGVFGLYGPLPKPVKDADYEAYCDEEARLMDRNLAWRPYVLAPEAAEALFLLRFREVYGSLPARKAA